jgi:hypothetical protein
LVGALGASVLVARRRRTAATPPRRSGGDVACRAARQAFAARRRGGARLRGSSKARSVDFGRGTWDALEEALIAADVGARTSAELLERIRGRGVSVEPSALRGALRGELLDALRDGGAVSPSRRPWVVLVTGVNGVGKTTTIGKIAALHGREGRKVLLVAADTFRAAAIDQLGVWAERTGSDFVRHAPGADPPPSCSTASAANAGADVVLIDTAGRLHTHSPAHGRASGRSVARSNASFLARPMRSCCARRDRRAERPQPGEGLRRGRRRDGVIDEVDGTAKGHDRRDRPQLGIPVGTSGSGRASTTSKPSTRRSSWTVSCRPAETPGRIAGRPAHDVEYPRWQEVASPE